MLFAGIDGGQSSTTAAIGGVDGRVLARGTAGPADEVDQSPSSSRLNDALNAALADALANANLDPSTRFTRVVAGISGYEGIVYGKTVALPADQTRLMHDSPIAQAGAFDGAPGIVIIAGTGSVVYGVNTSGASLLLGGWGYLFGDEGSAFGLARDA
ncbi:MAG: BadF/BadG/BcrA/BcrD ATPase family protein, partial [Candidatus Baltobacteraceae bacterium]